MIPSYGGLVIFGATCTCNVALEGRARQINTFCGVNGLEVLDLGSRGATATVEGTWFFGSYAELSTTLATWNELVDGTPRTLVDSKGGIWPNALLDPYKLDGAARTNPDGIWIQKFSGSLLILAVGT